MSALALLGGSQALTRPLPTWPVWDDNDRRAVLDVLDSGNWWMYATGESELDGADDGDGDSHQTSGNQTSGSQVELFEREFAAAHGAKHALAVTSGSTALEICMRAIDLKPGDEVITTPYTFIATSTCILNAGALPVFVDIDPETFNIDPQLIEAAITDRTRAILPVYFAGEMADIEAICEIAARRNLRVIEDAAQAPGVCLKGDRYAGTFGDAGIFSFQASKTLNSGEGGVILTNSDEFAERVWGLRHCGRTKDSLWYEHHHLGFNARMTEFCGALLRTQLVRLDDQNNLRMANASRFFDQLRDVDGLTPAKLHPHATRRSHYLVILRYDEAAWDGLSRERFLEALNAEGVPAMAGYTFPSFENPLFENIDFSSDKSIYMMGRSTPIDYQSFAEKCPHTMRACHKQAVWLTHTPFLGDDRLIDEMVEAIKKVRTNYRELL